MNGKIIWDIVFNDMKGVIEMRIESLEQLRKECKSGAEFFILLNRNLRSRKWIIWNDVNNKFFIHNFIDETEQELTEYQLMDRKWTNLGYL